MGARILVVDDDEIFRTLTAAILTDAGFDVEEAADYRNALPALERQQNPIELLITDIVMPGRISGFALARMARMRRLRLPVIYLTGSDKDTAEAIGPVLIKSTDFTALLQAVSKSLADGKAS
jgi:CheY-like chemotaxis protein